MSATLEIKNMPSKFIVKNLDIDKYLVGGNADGSFNVEDASRFDHKQDAYDFIKGTKSDSIGSFYYGTGNNFSIIEIFSKYE